MHAIYNPASQATPSQIEFRSRYRLARERITAAARGEEPPKPVELKGTYGAHEPEVVVDTIADWVERQKAKYPKPWFVVLADLGDAPNRGPGVSEIQRAVARHYGMALEVLLSPSRKAEICFPRMVAIYISKVLTGRSLPELGRRFGNMDHTSILHAVRKIGRLIQVDAVLASTVEQIIGSFVERA